MSNDPYAAPSADLHADDAIIQTSTWTAKGRLSSLSYLGQSLLLFIAAALAFFAMVLVFAASFGGLENAANILQNMENLGDSEFLENMPVLPLVGVFLIIILMLYLSTCLLIKRLHDRGHNGWWSLPLILVSIIPGIGLITIIPYLYLMFWPGQKRANRFGGQRATKGWEKVLGILLTILLLIPIISVIALFATGGGASFLEAGAPLN